MLDDALHTSPAARMIETVLRCKWNLAVLHCLQHGMLRPGAIHRQFEGLSKKVLYERLHALQGLGIIQKQTLSTSPLAVEYHLTTTGEKFLHVLDSIVALQQELDATEHRSPLEDKVVTDR